MEFDWGDLVTAVIAVVVGSVSSFVFAVKLRDKDNQSSRLSALYSVFKEIKEELNRQVEEYWSKGNEGSQENIPFSRPERKILETRMVVSAAQLFKIGSSLMKHCPDDSSAEKIKSGLLEVHGIATGGDFHSKKRKSDNAVIKKCRTTLNNINIDFISIL